MLESILEPKLQIPEERKRFDNAALRKLIIPIIIEQFLAVLVGMVDTLMISYAGEEAVSGVSLVNQFNTVFITFFSSLAAGGAVVASQYMGTKDRRKGSLAAGQLLMFVTLFSLCIMALLLLFGTELFDALFRTVEEGVRDSGLTYLAITACSFPFLAIYNACAGLYRSMGKTREVMLVSLGMNLVNVAGNAIGVFALHAGVRGVAYPSLISRGLAALVMLVLVHKKTNPLYVEPSCIFRWEGSMLARILRIAIPGGIEGGLFQLSKLVISALIADYGTVQIAAYGIGQSFWGIGSLFCIGMGPAFITIVGQYMGAGDVEGARYYMKKLLRITFAGAIIWNIVAFLVTPLFLLLYNISNETKTLVLIIVLIHNGFNGLIAPMSFSLANGLQAAGDVKYTMAAAIFATVVMRTLLSILMGSILGWGVIGTTIAMVCDWAIKAALVMIRYGSGKWTTKKVI